MKVAIVHMGPAFGVSFLYSTANVPRFLTQASAYRDSTRFFTDYVEDPCPDLDLDMLPRDLPRGRRLALLAERIRLFAPDIIEAHEDRHVAFFLARRFRDIPVTLTLHSCYRRQNLWNRFFRSLRFFALARFLCVSDYARDSYRRGYPLYASRIITLRNAVPREGFLEDARKKEKIVFWSSRSAPEKGLMEHAEAMTKALPALQDWRSVVAVLARTKEERRYFEEARARLAPSVRERSLWLLNLAHQESVSWMRKSAIFVAPYPPGRWEEPCPLSLFEAHLGGAAVISSGRGGMPEVSGKEGAFYLKEVSGETVAEAIKRLAENDEERIALAKRGQDYVLKHHRIEDRAKELDALRRQIIRAS